MKQPQQILTEAIKLYKPRQIVCLFSGGYDSMCATHLAHSLETHGVPLSVWAIDTKLSADGWTEYVSSVGEELQFNDCHIYDNRKGFEQFVAWVTEQGCPYTLGMHGRAYHRLKERGIEAIHMLYKIGRHDKTLMLTGMRRSESRDRGDMPEYSRKGTSNICFVAPIIHWTDEDIARYRIERDLPENPFYNTVRGSGDCQCNWGNFIDMQSLEYFSPQLAAGNVALLDSLSRDNHGYGWDGVPPVAVHPDQMPLLDDDSCGPFLCSNCSRRSGKHQAAEQVILQRGIF
jgi:3'-phosphoadenosine 5'-phosphosulfate sulfotransferase (PAPS reductase)/FAD synthetase